MRPLILSFFCSYINYSLFFDKKIDKSFSKLQHENAVSMDNKVSETNSIDTILIFKDRTVFIVR